MRERRTVAIAAGFLAALAVAGCVGFSAASGGKPWVAQDVSTGARAVLGHSRDESAFLAYARRYTPRQNGRAWITAHPAEILAAGHDSCNWLAGQPRHGAELTVLLHQYLDAAGQQAFASALPMSGRATVVTGAWAHLCWGTRESRRVHDRDDDDD